MGDRGCSHVEVRACAVKKMEHWQAVRAKRSRDHYIHCTQLEFTDDSIIFTVLGTQSDKYKVEIAENVDLWPPTCTCDDYMWRGGDFLCKHICYCLRLMGVDESALCEICWEPEDQKTLLDYLCNAPDVVGDRRHDIQHDACSEK